MSDTIEPRAVEKELTCWSSASSRRARFDYDSKQYRMSEMLNDKFFGHCFALLKDGDYVTLTDCEDQVVTVRIDLVDKSARKAFLSRIDRLYAIPVVTLKSDLPDDPGLTYRYRSPRGGGHSVIASDGSVFAVNFDTRTEAERCISNCYEVKVFAPPVGHEPTEMFVSKNSKIYQPRV